MRFVSPLARRAAALALITAVMALAPACRKSPYEEQAPKLSRITVFSTGGNALWTWNESRHALVEGVAPADLPALAYGHGWTQGGQDVDGPWVSASSRSDRECRKWPNWPDMSGSACPRARPMQRTVCGSTRASS